MIDEYTEEMFEYPLVHDGIGEVEAGYIEQIRELEKLGAMTAAHTGIKTLVLKAARAVDQIKPNDAASGRANLLKALNDIASRLPEPPTTAISTLDTIREIMSAPVEANPFQRLVTA